MRARRRRARGAVGLILAAAAVSAAGASPGEDALVGWLRAWLEREQAVRDPRVHVERSLAGFRRRLQGLDLDPRRPADARWIRAFRAALDGYQLARPGREVTRPALRSVDRPLEQAAASLMVVTLHELEETFPRPGGAAAEGALFARATAWRWWVDEQFQVRFPPSMWSADAAGREREAYLRWVALRRRFRTPAEEVTGASVPGERGPLEGDDLYDAFHWCEVFSVRQRTPEQQREEFRIRDDARRVFQGRASWRPSLSTWGRGDDDPVPPRSPRVLTSGVVEAGWIFYEWMRCHDVAAARMRPELEAFLDALEGLELERSRAADARVLDEFFERVVNEELKVDFHLIGTLSQQTEPPHYARQALRKIVNSVNQALEETSCERVDPMMTWLRGMELVHETMANSTRREGRELGQHPTSPVDLRDGAWRRCAADG